MIMQEGVFHSVSLVNLDVFLIGDTHGRYR